MANRSHNPTITPTSARNGIALTRRALLALAATVSMLVSGALSATQALQAGSAGVPNELIDAVGDYRQATMRGDITTLSNLVTDDYVLVNSDSSLQAKQSYLDDFKLPGFKVNQYVVEQTAYEVWGDTALVRGLLHLAWTQDGKQHGRALRIAHVLTRHDGRWQIAYTQLTRVPDQ